MFIVARATLLFMPSLLSLLVVLVLCDTFAWCVLRRATNVWSLSPYLVVQLHTRGDDILPLASLSRDVVKFVVPVAANEVPLFRLPFWAYTALRFRFAASMEQAAVAGVFICLRRAG